MNTQQFPPFYTPVDDPLGTLRQEIAVTEPSKLPKPDFAWTLWYRTVQVCDRPFVMREWTELVQQLIEYRQRCEEEPCNWWLLAEETPKHYPDDGCHACQIREVSSAADKRAQALIASVHAQQPAVLGRLEGEVAGAYIDRVTDFWSRSKQDLPKKVQRQFDAAVAEVADALSEHEPPKDGSLMEKALLARVNHPIRVHAFLAGDDPSDPSDAVMARLSSQDLLDSLEIPAVRRCLGKRLLPNGCPVREMVLESHHCEFLLKGLVAKRTWCDLFFALADVAGEEDAPLLEAIASWKRCELIFAPAASRARHANILGKVDHAEMTKNRSSLWNQFHLCRDRQAQRAFVELAVHHTDKRWSVPTRVSSDLVRFIPIESVETVLERWKVNGLKEAIAPRLPGHASSLGPLGASALYDHCVENQEWKLAMELLKGRPELLDQADGFPTFPPLEILERVVALYQQREGASAATFSRTLVERHLDQLRRHPEILRDLILLPCQLGGKEELLAAHKMWLELHRGKRITRKVSELIQMGFFDPIQRLISATPTNQECDDLAVVQVASFETWEQNMPPLIDDNLALFDAVLTARLLDDRGRGEALNVLYKTAERQPHLPRVRWAIEETIRVVRSRSGDTLLALRALLRLAMRHAGWDASQLAEVALEQVRRGRTAHELQTLLAPQGFRIKKDYHMEIMRDVYFAFAEGIVEHDLSTDHLLLALGQLRFLQAMGSSGFDRERLDRLLERRRWAPAAYEGADKMFGGTFPEEGTPSLHSRIIVETAFRSANDPHDEKFAELDYQNVRQLAERARMRMRRCHQFRGELPPKWRLVAEDNDRLWQGALARDGDAEALATLRAPLDAQLHQGCRDLAKVEWRALMQRLVSSCSHYSAPSETEQHEKMLRLLESAKGAGLFEGTQPVLIDLLQQISDKRALGIDMAGRIQRLVGNGVKRVTVVQMPCAKSSGCV